VTSIVLATPDDRFEQRVRELEPPVSAQVRRWDPARFSGDVARAAEEIAAMDPDVVVVGPRVAIDSALELVRTFDLLHPHVTAMLVADPTPEVLRSALHAGAREVVSPESAGADLREAIDRIAHAAARRRASIATAVSEPRSGRVIAVVSAKGGVGKTTVSTNIAAGLARIAPDEVVIVDLDLQFGDVTTAVRLLPEATILDAVRVGDRLDETMLKAYLCAHERGFYALAAPDQPADADEIEGAASARIIRMLADIFSYVVVDTGSGLDEHTLAMLDVATDVVVVTSTDVPSVRAARKEIETLRALGVENRNWHVVLNRADARVGLAADDIELTIGMGIDVAVPSSRAIPISLNEGTPVLLSDDRAPVARALGALVGRIGGSPAQAPSVHRGGWFRRGAPAPRFDFDSLARSAP
jgi:pilus assembly protein CpaE